MKQITLKAALDEARTQLVLDRQPFINHINSEDSLNTPQKRTIKIKLIMQRITES